MLYEQEPKGFNPKFEVSSLFMQVGNEFVLLKRLSTKPQPEKWGVPAGKDEGEGFLKTVIHETEQETGVQLDASTIKFFKRVFVRYLEYDFIYNMFHTLLSQKPQITINLSEHSDFVWATPFQALQMDLIEDLDTCIRMFYKIRE